MDLAWIFWGRENLKRADKFGAISGQNSRQNSCQFPVNSGPDSCHKIKNPRRAPTLVPSMDCVLSSRTERPSDSAPSMQGKGRMNEMFLATKNSYKNFCASAAANFLGPASFRVICRFLVSWNVLAEVAQGCPKTYVPLQERKNGGKKQESQNPPPQKKSSYKFGDRDKGGSKRTER